MAVYKVITTLADFSSKDNQIIIYPKTTAKATYISENIDVKTYLQNLLTTTTKANISNGTKITFTNKQGSKIYSFLNGTNGKNGTDGSNGKNGRNGVDGIDGKNGKDGINGKDGKNGINGNKGITGNKGPKGDKGLTGDKGPKGLKGDTGAKGIKGDKGDTGATGAKGNTGPKGDTGKNGTNGVNGKPPNLKITVLEGPSAAKITEYIESSNTYKIDLYVPKAKDDNLVLVGKPTISGSGSLIEGDKVTYTFKADPLLKGASIKSFSVKYGNTNKNLTASNNQATLAITAGNSDFKITCTATDTYSNKSPEANKSVSVPTMRYGGCQWRKDSSTGIITLVYQDINDNWKALNINSQKYNGHFFKLITQCGVKEETYPIKNKVKLVSAVTGKVALPDPLTNYDNFRNTLKSNINHNIETGAKARQLWYAVNAKNTGVLSHSQMPLSTYLEVYNHFGENSKWVIPNIYQASIIWFIYHKLFNTSGTIEMLACSGYGNPVQSHCVIQRVNNSKYYLKGIDHITAVPTSFKPKSAGWADNWVIVMIQDVSLPSWFKK